MPGRLPEGVTSAVKAVELCGATLLGDADIGARESVLSGSGEGTPWNLAEAVVLEAGTGLVLADRPGDVLVDTVEEGTLGFC